MEASFDSEQEGQEYFLSWTAYVLPFFLFVVLEFAGIALVLTSTKQAVQWTGLALCLAALAHFLYKFLMLRSIRLYTDDAGVWLFRGILPWAKGVMGVMWRDLDDAVYFTGFFSWVLRSYTIRVSHRFTKKSEIFVTNVAYGNLAVEHINSVVREIVSRGAQN